MGADKGYAAALAPPEEPTHTARAQVRKVPLEVFVKGDKAPIYGSTFDDDGRGSVSASS